MKLHAITLIALIGASQFGPTLTHVTTAQNPDDPFGKRRLGRVSGIVMDRSGATLPGVKVIIMTPDGAEREVVTDENGRYRFNGVRPGKNYSLSVIATGFSVTKLYKITVKENENTSVPIQLAFGPAPTPSPVASPQPSQRPSPLPSPMPSVMPTPRPTPRSSPSPGPSPNSTDWEAMIKAQEQKLHESKITFNPPTEMQEQKTDTIQARISFEDIGSTLTQGLQGPGTAQVEPLKVSEIMKVTLTGDGNAFLIQRIGEEEQVVAGKQYAQWEWHVTPLQSGGQKLTLTATATIYLQGRGEKPIYYKTLEKPILVHVDRWYTTKQFVANNWQWLWAVVVVPAAGLLWGLRRRKTRRAGFR